MSTKYDRLKNLLLELFQLDKPDLDFGIYRIMHARAAEISGFLDSDLLPQVRQALAVYDQGNRAQLEADLNEARAKASELGIDPEQTPRVVELRAQLADASKADAIEGEVYDLIYRFFSRYYSEGDFISQRRYTSESSYAIPYNGEEVTLHWANKDQYYIKTSEYLRDYAFRLNVHDDANPMRVHFKLVDATEGEHGNVKATEGTARVFVLADAGASGHDFVAVDADELTIRFEYRPATNADWPADQRAGQAKPPKQKDLAAFAESAVLACGDPELAPWVRALAVPRSGSPKSMIASHIERYVARNTFDYFIHKDLGTFLRRELDFFIKNEVMRLDDIEDESAAKVEQYLSKIKAVRKVAGKIIDFLAQLEDFQKKLWLKKKFVVGTSYLITVGNIDEQFYDEICANDAQREEWVQLFAIDKLEGDLVTAAYSAPLTPSFLKSHPTLTLNTEQFSAEFTGRLLESLDGIDGSLDRATDGLLINGENFQALGMLGTRYSRAVNFVYIDPPYNTDGDGFAYKDSYRRSSWAAMMTDRLALTRSLLSRHGALVTAIGRDEFHRLTAVADQVMGEHNRVAELVWEKGRKNDAKHVSLGHDHMLVYALDLQAMKDEGVVWRESKPGAAEILQEFSRLQAMHGSELGEVQAGIREFYKALPKDHPSLRHRRYNRVDANGLWRDHDISWPGGGGPRYEVPHPSTGQPCKIPDTGWRFATRAKFDLYDSAGFIEFRPDHTETPFLKRYLNFVSTEFDPDARRLTSIIAEGDDEEENVQVMPSVIYKNQQPTVKELRHIMGSDVFKNPKDPEVVARLVTLMSSPDGTVMDHFAGSGTTGHSVIASNRLSAGKRQFILCEAGDHFDSVLLTRLRRVTFTPDWKDGTPARAPSDREIERSPRIMKVLRLESYEDTLNNLDLRRDERQQSLLDSPAAVALREGYTLRYMLDVESRGSQSLLNVAAFTDPTAYQLNVKSPGSDESRLVNADLLETFNYLIGLTVIQITAPRSFAVTFERDDEKRLQIASFRQAAEGPHWFRTVTGTSPDGQRVLVIWRKRAGGDDPDGVEQDNAVLDHWFTNKQQYSVRDSEFDVIYVNGDNNLENMKRPDETWKVRLIEEDFHRLMFDTDGMP